MKHLGDITKINGAEIPVVDCIIGGSPCQDLSTAGKRAGLAGQRSCLFMEQIRIVKEMREHDRRTNLRTDIFVRPRWVVWENVPGSLSSGKEKGADFAAVIEEFCKIAKGDAVISVPDGGWPHAGCVSGIGDDGTPFSVAWRLHDAQFWGATQYADGRMLVPGTPQRRKRIALVADFGGFAAPAVLFEQEGLSWNPETRGAAREETARGTGESADSTSWTLKIRGGVERDSNGRQAGKGALVQEEMSGTIGVAQDQTLIRAYRKTAHPTTDDGAQGYEQTDTYDTLNAYDSTEARTPTIAFGISPYESNAMKSANPNSGIYKADTSRTLDLNGGNPACNQGGLAVVCLEGNGSRDSHRGDGFKESEVMYTLNTVEQHGVVSIEKSDGEE